MKVILEKTKCISCGTCIALCPDIFEAEEDGKSHLKGCKTAEQEELETGTLDCVKDAADACPVQCIIIK